LRQGLAFRGHDESLDSLNKGNFRELLSWLAGNFEEVNQVVLGNAPQNCQMVDHKIQKELIHVVLKKQPDWSWRNLAMSVLQFLLMSLVIPT
jgi:hypothetical protein